MTRHFSVDIVHIRLHYRYRRGQRVEGLLLSQDGKRTVFLAIKPEGAKLFSQIELPLTVR